MPQPTTLDWSRHTVLASPKPCRLCGQPAFMTDEQGLPCHKVCAEGTAAARGETT